MPWVRIDERAMHHPKIRSIADGAFRLWVEGLAYCQMFLTDGKITDQALRGLWAYSPKRRHQLIESGLWELSPLGVQVHDYLQWNESREHVISAREHARERIQKLRGKRRCNADVTPLQRENTSGGVVCMGTRGSLLKEEGGMGETISARAGRFCEWYEDAHQRLLGVAYIGTRNDYEAACRLADKLTDQEMRDAATVWFGDEDKWATSGTRTVPKFASRATGYLQLMRAKGIA